MKRIERQIRFIEELDKLKTVMRRNFVMDESRHENSAEHSWHVALMAMILDEYAPVALDQFKVVKMLLLHDVVEIQAGDTFCYDIEGNKDKEEREKRAADSLFALLPDDIGAEYRQLWDEFESGMTAEACFANSLDRFHTLLQNMNTNGGTWRIHNIDKQQVLERMAPIKEGAPALWPLVEKYLAQAEEEGTLGF